MKISVVLGTRPEIIKMASVIDEINKRGHELLLIHTGQHYDKEMSENFFKDLELPIPQYNIHVGSGAHGEQTGRMMEGIEEVLMEEKPDIVLVQGDTNAVLAGALVASKLHIPIGHVEAGLRSFDETMPEEINRLVADVTTKLYFVPTKESALNLISEGISHKQIIITGNTVVDACFRNLKIAEKRETSQYDEGLRNLDLENMNNIVTLTMHRAENVDVKERLMNIINALLKLEEVDIIFPIHPRTRNTLKNFNLLEKLENTKHIHLIKPVGYLDFLLLLSKSKFILTDSGGLQEEAITLNIPALTLRYNTERPETVTAGGNILVGSNTEKILENAKRILEDEKFCNDMKNAVNPYGEGNAAAMMLDSIEEAYANNELNITAPETVMSTFTRKMENITENITVGDFEENNNCLIHLIYSDTLEFPEAKLNLKDKIIFYDQYAS